MLPVNRLDDALAIDEEIDAFSDDTADEADERMRLAEVALPIMVVPVDI